VTHLAICLCFKNASTYLDEWLAYYRAVGVDYFYLYDNDSSDDFRAVLGPYLKKGFAELHRWPGLAQQQAIYTDCLKRARRKVRWLGFLDDDEFLWPVLDPDLPTALKRYESYAGVAVCWYLYGSSNHKTRPRGSVIENFTWRAREPDGHVKCIVSPERVQKPLEVGHSFLCEPGYTIVNEHLRDVSSPQVSAPSGHLLRVNHYATKSIEEMRQRRTQPQADTGKVTAHPLSLWDFWAHSWNHTQDLGIHRFIPRMQEIQAEMAALRDNAENSPQLWRGWQRLLADIGKKAAAALGRKQETLYENHRGEL